MSIYQEATAITYDTASNVWTDNLVQELVGNRRSQQLNIIKDNHDIRSSIKLLPCTQGMCVFVVAVNPRGGNSRLKIPAFGKPLIETNYNIAQDFVSLEGVDLMKIGSIPFNYQLVFEYIDYRMDIPMPESVLMRYLNAKQQTNLELFKDRYSEKDYLFVYPQFMKTYP